jgi:hypothetical protein
MIQKKIELLFHIYSEYIDSTTNEIMATTMMNEQQPNGGICRMTDDYQYEAEFNGTPRPGTTSTADDDNDTQAASATAAARRAASSRAMWTFSQAATAAAADLKRRRSLTSRTVYRMGMNSKVKAAFDTLMTNIQNKRQSAAAAAAAAASGAEVSTMSDEDFNLLKLAISKFCVRITVHDSLTVDQLMEQQKQSTKQLIQHTAMMQELAWSEKSPESQPSLEYIQNERMKNEDLAYWNSALSSELYRLTNLSDNRVPSQHVQIATSSGNTLRNILTPQTIRRKFISLNALTRTIRTELLAFLTSRLHSDDIARARVVQEIKDSIAKTAREKKLTSKKQEEGQH